MRAEERRSLRQRFGFRCGYYGVSERDVGSELTFDHFQPRSRGGSDDRDNWVYSCHPCTPATNSKETALESSTACRTSA